MFIDIVKISVKAGDGGEWEQLTDGRDYDRIEELDEKIDEINDNLFDLYHEDETTEVLAEIEEKEAELKELEEREEEERCAII